MAKIASSLGFFDYVKAAFNWKVKLKGLGFFPLNNDPGWFCDFRLWASRFLVPGTRL